MLTNEDRKEPELKPCPFCGSEAMTSWNDKFGWQVFCGNDSCFMSQIITTTFETEEQAIQSWNNRTRYDKQEPEIGCKDCTLRECEGRNGLIVCDKNGESHEPNYSCEDYNNNFVRSRK